MADSAVPDPRVGLCGQCAFARVVMSGRASRFWLCERSRSDPSFPRYPPLPIRACRGFKPEAPGPAQAEA